MLNAQEAYECAIKNARQKCAIKNAVNESVENLTAYRYSVDICDVRNLINTNTEANDYFMVTRKKMLDMASSLMEKA
jgi:hypothetical protein